MSIGLNLFGLFLMTTVGVSIGAIDQACVTKLSNCGGESLAVLTKATHGVQLNEYGKDALENLCRDQDKLTDCLEAAEAVCPEEVIEQYRTNLKMVTLSCDNIECTKKIIDCGSDVSEMFRLGMTSDPAQYLKLGGGGGIDDICNKLDSLKACIKGAESECGSQVAAWNVQVDVMRPVCNVLPCGNKIKACFGNFTTDLIMPTFDVWALQSVCSRTTVTNSCIQKITECPEETTNYYSDAMDTYLSKCATIDGCQKDVRDCAGDSASTFFSAVGRRQFEVATVEKLCPVKDRLAECFDKSDSCKDYADQYDAVITTYVQQGCDYIPCSKKLEDCMGEVGKAFMSGEGYSSGRTEAICEKKDQIRECLDEAHSECPSEYINLQKAKLQEWITQSCDYSACSKKLEQCMGEVGKAFMSGEGYNSDRMEAICGKEDQIRRCLDEAHSKCSSTDINIQRDTLHKVLRQQCALNPCVKKVDACNGEIRRIFLKGKDIGAGGLGKLCDETEAIKACFEGMRGVCPDNYTDSYKATITQAQKGCQYKSCAQKLQDCGVKVMDDVNVLRLNKETLVSFCENVITVKTCMDSVGSECTQEIKDMWNGPTKQYSDRCADIVKKYKVTKATTGGSNVVIVLKLDMTWDEKYLHLEDEGTQPLVANLKTSLTNIYKDTPGFQEVKIERLFKSSVGVVHSVVYKQPVTNKDLASISATLMAALDDNGGSLTVGGDTFQTAGTPQMQFADNSYEISDKCALYTIDKKCQHGGACKQSETGARCVCTGPYHGDYCGDDVAGQGVLLPGLIAILVSLAVGLLLAV